MGPIDAWAPAQAAGTPVDPHLDDQSDHHRSSSVWSDCVAAASAATKDFFDDWFAAGGYFASLPAQQGGKVAAAVRDLPRKIGEKNASGGDEGTSDGNSDDQVLPFDVPDFLEADVHGKAEEEVVMQSGIFPFFTLGTSTVAASVWFITVHALHDENKHGKSWTAALGGLELVWPGKTDLRLNDDCQDFRADCWRWLSYQFTHLGVQHIVANCILNLVLGVPLERLHGSWKAALMYNIGVFGGACCYFVGDSRHSVVGMSGGCYSLWGVTLAYLIINWHQKKYRYVWVIILVVAACTDVGINLHAAMDKSFKSRVSVSTHLGGAIAGLVIGIVAGENLHVKTWEVILRWSTLMVGIILVVFCISWAMFWPPMNVFDQVRWCWSRQVYNMTLFGQPQWRCVRCRDQACVDRWSQQLWIASATIEKCEEQLGWFENS